MIYSHDRLDRKSTYHNRCGTRERSGQQVRHLCEHRTRALDEVRGLRGWLSGRAAGRLAGGARGLGSGLSRGLSRRATGWLTGRRSRRHSRIGRWSSRLGGGYCSGVGCWLCRGVGRGLRRWGNRGVTRVTRGSRRPCRRLGCRVCGVR